MNEFNSFKKKIVLEAIIKSIIISFSLFFIIFGVTFILSKREIIDLPIWLDFIIGFGSGLIVFLLMYFIFKPNDKKIAIRLDNDFNLNEKVQTMLEYKDQEGIVINLQREDTLNKLNEITPKRLKIKIHYILYVILALGCATLITSISIPKLEHPIIEPIDPDESYTLTEWQILQIQKLIKYVDDSKMLDDMKSSYKSELNLLIEALDASTKEVQMKNNVLTSIASINLLMLKESTNKQLYTTLNEILNYNLVTSISNSEYALKENDKLEFVVDGINASTVSLSFIPYTTTNNKGESIEVKLDPILVDVSANERFGLLHEFNVKKDGNYKIELNSGTYLIETLGDSNYKLLAEACNAYNAMEVSEVISSIQNKYLEAYDISPRAAVYMIGNDVTNLKAALENTTLSEDDPLYTSLNTYVSALEATLNGNVLKLKDNVKSALDAIEPIYTYEISQKRENRDVAWYIEDKLRELFGLPKATDREDADDSDSSNSGSDSGENGNQDFTGGGGLGDGDFIFSSTDLIYDYENNELVMYGELYDSYYAIINGLINEGELTEEMVAYINAYYSSLLKVNNKE